MCRKTLFMTAYARDRSSRGYGWRNSERHIALRRMLWSTRSRKLTGLLLPRRASPGSGGSGLHRRSLAPDRMDAEREPADREGRQTNNSQRLKVRIREPEQDHG